MKVCRLENNVVVEIIPAYALPVEKWYGPAFAASCVEAPDDVAQHWTYNPKTGTWAEPQPDPDLEPTPTTDERVAALENENAMLKAQVSAQSDQMDFYEDCIAEMATVVYA